MPARTCRMVLFCTLLPTLLLGTWETCSEAGEFPYKAYVTHDKVYVRSGPGKNYYPTSRLAIDEVVEVYRHDPGGWYAIRPPEGSFTWVSSRFLEMVDKDIAVATGDRVLARVGSELSEARDVWQVKLREGEEVVVLDVVEDGSQSWYKIAPPAGEFRWIFGRYVEPANPDLAPEGSYTGQQPGFEILQPTPELGFDEKLERGTRRTSSTASRGTVEHASAQQILPADEPTGPPRELGQGFRQLRQSRGVQQPPIFDPVADAKVTLTLQNELDAVDLTLSKIVSGNIQAKPEVFEVLLHQTQVVLDKADDVRVQQAATALADKIQRFAQIEASKRTLTREIVATEQQAGLPPDPSVLPVEETGEDRFDGYGRLTPVISKNVGAPQYALIDETGRVKCFVSAAPDVNLRPYLHQWIGVTGTRTFREDLTARLISAQRVTPLRRR